MNRFEKALVAAGAIVLGAAPARNIEQPPAKTVDLATAAGTTSEEISAAEKFDVHAQSLFADFKGKHPGLVPADYSVRTVCRNEYSPTPEGTMGEPVQVLTMIIEDRSGKAMGTIAIEEIATNDPALLGDSPLARAHVISKLGSIFDAGMNDILAKNPQR